MIKLNLQTFGGNGSGGGRGTGGASRRGGTGRLISSNTPEDREAIRTARRTRSSAPARRGGSAEAQEARNTESRTVNTRLNAAQRRELEAARNATSSAAERRGGSRRAAAARNTETLTAAQARRRRNR